jgi:hypothetical protein
VSVYPSEFGKIKMAEEQAHGPRDVFRPSDEAEADEEAEPAVADVDHADEDGLDQSKLRQYELDKLKYYFAVVECDSVATANALYQSLDGTELEHTSNVRPARVRTRSTRAHAHLQVIDMRFIPDEMQFSDAARDSSSKVPSRYEPAYFETNVLQHSKVKLTWDQDDPKRMKTVRQKFSKEVVANS